MKKEIKFAVVLAGCGVYDGAEIHETVMTFLAISKKGASYQAFAPDIDQYHVVDHVTGKPTLEKRNVLKEAARIARGKIKALSQFDATEFDILIFPGGFGVAKNLCTFAIDGSEMQVLSEVENAINQMHHLKKPIGALCIAPILLAKVLGDIQLTLGETSATSKAAEKMGASHFHVSSNEIIIDPVHKIVTSPCYMYDAKITEIQVGAENTVEALINLI